MEVSTGSLGDSRAVPPTAVPASPGLRQSDAATGYTGYHRVQATAWNRLLAWTQNDPTSTEQLVLLAKSKLKL